MKLHEPLHEGEADAEPARIALLRVIEPREDLEDAVEAVRWDARAGIRHDDDCVIAFAPRGNRDPAARVGVLARVVEQIAEHLRNPRRIDVDPEGRLRQRDAQLLP